jgi:TRAP-type uncharacterized transport system substrate-binding protein
MPASFRRVTAPVRQSISSHPRLVAFALIVAVVLVGAIAAKPPRQMTIETGPVGGSYYQAAEKYQALLAQKGITLELRPNPNSTEIIRNVANPKSGVDVGFIAQDVSSSHDAPVFIAGQIEVQPLFVFASAELGRRSTLDDLRGRKIVMPPADSATSEAAVRLFQLYDITPQNSQFAFMPLAEAAKELRAGRFDGGAFMLTPENPVIRELITDSGLNLVPIGEATAIGNQLPFLRPVQLPRGIYSIADAIPPINTPLIAAPVGLVVRNGLHPYLLYSLLQAVTQAHRAPTFVSRAGEFPSVIGSQLAVDPRAEQYYRSGLPWIYAELWPWPASIVAKYQLLIFASFLLAALYITAICLSDLFGFLWTSVASRKVAPAEPLVVETVVVTPPPPPPPAPAATTSRKVAAAKVKTTAVKGTADE